LTAHGTAGDNNRDLQRLESFFGANSPYVARRHLRDNRWTNDAEMVNASEEQRAIGDEAFTVIESSSQSAAPGQSRQFPVIDTEKLLEAPTAALDRLTQLTSEQLVNLQNASQQAGEIFKDFKGSAETSAGGILSNLEDVQRQLTPEVQAQVEKIGTVLEKQVNEAQDVLLQAVKAIKQQAEALSQQADFPSTSSASSSSKTTAQKNTAGPPPKQQQKQENQAPTTTITSTNTAAAAAELESIATRFKTEMQQLTDKIKLLSEVQFGNVHEVVLALEEELIQRSAQIRSFIAEKRVEINQRIGGVNAKAPPAAAQKQQQKAAAAAVASRATTAPPAKKTAGVVVHGQQSKSPLSTSAPAQQLTKTAEAVREIWHSKIQNKINLPSVSIPTPNFSNFDASKIKSVAAENPEAVALGASAFIVTAISVYLRKKAQGTTQAEQDAIKRARSRKRLERQRNRFKKALGTDDDGTGMIDSSVFAAVQRIQKNTKAVAGGDAANASVDIDNDDDDDGGALGSDPQSWDPAMKKEWNAFVKSSKLKDAALWDPNDVDEGLPEIYVDLDRE
jgi:hypothetical protein